VKLGRKDSDPPNDASQSKADWFAWGAHLLFGLFLGSGIGLVVAFRLVRIDWVREEGFLPLFLGMALFVGAMASHFGERLWDNVSIWDTACPPRSKLSKAVSVVIGAYGLLLLSYALWRGSSTYPDLGETSEVLVPFLILFAGLLVYSIRSERLILPWIIVEKAEAPFTFWFLLAITYGFGFLSLLRVCL
jgi:hypothetical protein